MDETNHGLDTGWDGGVPAPQAEDEFQQAYGESLAEATNLATWEAGDRLAEMYARMAEEVRVAVEQENRRSPRMREVVFGSVNEWRNAAPNAGLHCFRPEDIEWAHRSLLFNGGVEACDGTSVVHDALPITITQLGVCLVAYDGRQSAWTQRLYRRDLRQRIADPIEEVKALLTQRKQRSAIDTDDPADDLSELARRGIMTYAERAILLDYSTAPWRMGHGHPLAYELLTGKWAHHTAGGPDFVSKALGIMQRLVEHERFVYVPSAPQRDLWTVGFALRPMEYAILWTAEDYMEKMLAHGGYRGEARRKVERFARDVAPKVVTGLYRVHQAAPPQQFYAHADHAQTAALIAMADGALQWHRGFPMLIDLADTVCRGTFDVAGFMSSVQLAYTETGQPLAFEAERHTRR